MWKSKKQRQEQIKCSGCGVVFPDTASWAKHEPDCTDRNRWKFDPQKVSHALAFTETL